ncbi:oligopeptide transporter, OPT family [uncultured Alistipes sp.]|uniref:OPT family oligopeptide transporter n=1 Tax=uncultured Alistipes sp. TaxID=538949 RepID=UPI0025AF1EB9|nr:oligopeptide transporter, OPT family [uncultured Alistipes sp.]
MEENNPTSLPENAYRELKPGEEYTPLMPAASAPREETPYSVTMGVIMAVVFSAAAAFLGLKVGQVFEAAIPIAIIAVGMGNVLGKKNMLGQNVIIQSIGASSGVIVAGAIFTLPALYILGLDAAFWQVFLSSLFGGLLGIVLLIPFRKYFVKEMHGKYPFPEATATTEVLVSGEKGGSQAKLLAAAGLIGGLYDFVVGTFGLWTESVSTRICSWGAMAAEKFKVVFSVNTSAAVLGLGYIIGLKYALIITAGSALVWFIIVPVVGSLAEALDPAVMASLLGVTRDDLLADPQRLLAAENLFQFIGKPLGIGGIAMAGIIGIFKQSRIIRQAVGLAVTELRGSTRQPVAVGRTDRDLPMKRILAVLVATLASIFIFFHFGLLDGWIQSVTAILVVFVIAFLFTTVAANAIAIVGTNPVSGMTLMTLILSSLILVSVGLSGTTGMTAALVIGGVVCTALSMAGGFITDLKIGYWLGTTPRKQEAWKFLGTFVAAATVAGVMIVLNKAYGFVGEGALVAPQANAMAAVIQPLMTGGQTPWMLYFCGAVLALLLTLLDIPALAFALGMFIPMELNAPLVVGGLVAWFVSTRSKNADLNKARFDRGTLIASGFIAGGALMGVVSAVLKFCKVDWFLAEWASSNAAEWTGLAMYLLLAAYFAVHTMKAKTEK